MEIFDPNSFNRWSNNRDITQVNIPAKMGTTELCFAIPEEGVILVRFNSAKVGDAWS